MVKLKDVTKPKENIIFGKDLVKGSYYIHDKRVVICTESDAFGGKWADLSSGATGQSGAQCAWQEITGEFNYEIV